MSKGNMLLGHARGKVGSLVFSRSNGKQVVRAKADVVKNPKTEAQKIQRILLNTVAQAYSKMQAICDHSFENVKVGQDSMSYFMRQNINALRAKVAEAIAAGATMEEIFSFAPLGTALFVPNDYIISKGKLPKIDVVDASSDDAMIAVIANGTYEDVINAYGGQRGDQLTFVAVVGSGIDNCTFKFARIILDPTDANGNQLPLTTAFLNGTAVNAANPRNEGTISFTAAASGLEFTFGDTYMFAAAVIVSRKGENETWQRSDATLVANPSSSELVYSLQYALDASDANNIDTPNARYLNNSGNGRLAEGDTGEYTPLIGGAVYTSEGSPDITIRRGQSISLIGSGDLAVTVGGYNPRKTYKIALQSGDTLSNEVDVVDGAATMATSRSDAAGKSLVLVENGSVVDTYCSFT